MLATNSDLRRSASTASSRSAASSWTSAARASAALTIGPSTTVSSAISWLKACRCSTLPRSRHPIGPSRPTSGNASAAARPSAPPSGPRAIAVSPRSFWNAVIPSRKARTRTAVSSPSPRWSPSAATPCEPATANPSPSGTSTAAMPSWKIAAASAPTRRAIRAGSVSRLRAVARETSAARTRAACWRFRNTRAWSIRFHACAATLWRMRTERRRFVRSEARSMPAIFPALRAPAIDSRTRGHRRRHVGAKIPPTATRSRSSE